MKYIFANDFLNSRESIIMGRAFEALALENVVYMKEVLNSPFFRVNIEIFYQFTTLVTW